MLCLCLKCNCKRETGFEWPGLKLVKRYKGWVDKCGKLIG